ncbi:MAG: ribosome biogenesis GTPase YlqF [Defluviitaleaceae bacterium]|nr:ribosome biogenesis GTPase YlqF [Defluviitaleaceae bacterium]
MENIHWYPGHMAKAKKAILNDLKLVDIVIEILDARIPYSSKNPEIDIWSKKPKIVILNKVDMADEKSTAIWRKYFENKNPVILTNARGESSFKNITDIAESIMKEKLEKLKSRGRIFKPIRAMIVGIPNVGKSTFINSYVNKYIAKVANKPGVTRNNQWIKINKSFELLDTPGMLAPKLTTETGGLNLALTGAIGYTLDNYSLSIKLLEILKKRYPKLLIERYKLKNIENTSINILNEIANNRGFFIKGGDLDINRTSNMILEELRSTKIGKITLELPNDINQDL